MEDLHEYLNHWLQKLNQDRVTAGRDPLQTPKLQTLEDVLWAAGQKGSIAKLGLCVCVDGYRIERVNGVEYAKRCECGPFALACKRYSEAGVPVLAGIAGRSLLPRAQDPVRGMDWERYEGAAGHVIRQWLRNAQQDTPSQPTLLLTGRTGTGKTHAAAGIVRSMLFSPEWRTAEASARWVRWRDYLDECRRSQERRDELRAARLLVVDELTQCAGEWGATELEDLLDARGTACKPTVITTNIAPKALANDVGDRAESRLVGGGCVVEMLAADYRKAAA